MSRKILEDFPSFEICLKYLRLVALDPTAQSKKEKIKSGFILLYLLFVVIWIMSSFYFEKLDLEMFALLVKSLMLATNMLTKQYILIIHADDLKSLLYEHALDWSQSNKNQTKEISYETSRKLFKIFTLVFLTNMLILFLNPWLFDSLPVAFYSGPLNFWLLYVFQIVFLSYSSYLFLCFDVLYVSICIYIANQLRHLNCFLRNISYTNKREMREGVIRHVFLRRLATRAARIYSVLFTMNIWIVIGIICVEAYGNIKMTGTITQTLENVAVYIAMLVGISFYVFTALKVTDEQIKLADSIYNSNWYDADPSVKKYVLLALMRSQSPIYFTASGFATISRLTLIFIIQTTISYYTFLREMYALNSSPEV